MDGPRFRCVLSSSAARRLDAARTFALSYSPSQPLNIVAAAGLSKAQVDWINGGLAAKLFRIQ